MSDNITITRLGWRLLEWTLMGGNYRSLAKLVKTCDTVEDLAQKISETTPYAYSEALPFATEVFQPMKDRS